ncbi:hypothetical protein Lesp02_07740 [Lentzea sp. NBRC 105346]|uniref:alpha-L-fucosidase n=1 Tax=Lentzea sp. NBRC 105346 TaxID=3032205 RepID=UPI0024A4EA54|nr:alpha-L-fucosidase [Lentzea sp. NBRC 105346]GLZ28584.1 hypothetical protein Lesp02_07740 [Lentzea sp. NBRC 105346]
MSIRAFASVALVLASALTVPVAGAAAGASVVAIDSDDTDAQVLEKAGSVVPSERQRTWQRMELTAFHHFGPNTFTDREWGTGTEDPDVFNPEDLDTDQWMRTLRDTGFKQAILTVKHHDGFLLYPTRYSTHSVKYSSWQDGGGDVVRSFVDSARRHGLKVGFYLSPADLHEAQPGGRFGNNSKPVETEIPEVGLDGTRPDGPRFTVTANDYNRFYLNTMYELLTEYGHIDEVWWDGADAVGGSKEKFVYPDWIRLVRTLQPDAVIFQDGGPDVRWVGNESGVARTREHSVLPFNGEADGAEDRLTKPDDNGAADLGSNALITQRRPDGSRRWDYLKWLPAECDTPIGGGWFWHPGQDPKSLGELQSIYYASVGRNCQLLLNIAPDRRGKLPDADVQRLTELAQWRHDVFGTDFARGARATATTSTPGNPPARAVDGDDTTSWQPTGRTGTLTLDLRRERTVGAIGLQENLGVGQRVTGFAVDAWNGSAWQQVATGTTIGYKRLLKLSPSVTTTRLRLRVTASRALPAIASFSVHAPGR